MKDFLKKLLWGFLLFGGSSAVAASFTLTGRLANGFEKLAESASYEATLALYDSPTATEVLWARRVTLYPNKEGLYQVEVGDASEPAAVAARCETLAELFADRSRGTYFVGLDIVGEGECEPRQRLVSVPFARTADNVYTATGDLTVGGAGNTAAKLQVSNLVVTEDVEVPHLEIEQKGGALTVQQLEAGVSLTIQGTLKIEGNLKLTGELAATNNGTVAISAPGVIPVGGIVIWTQSKIPDGWAICDGQNNTPDLRGRFVMGTLSTELVATGGVAAVTLTVDNLPRHKHGFKQSVAKKTTQNWAWSDYDETGGSVWADYNKGATYFSGTTSSNPGAADKKVEPHENRPPYYAVYYIMRTR